MNLTAKWIWLDRPERSPRHTLAVARKSFRLPAFASATLAITADTQYRLFINGQWIEDGPCRSWPQRYQYDVVDVTHCLRPGRNTIAVAVLHYGLSTFHQLPQEAGLLAQLDVTLADGRRKRIVTNKSWRMQLDPGWRTDTARISIQMEHAEWYDAGAGLVGFAAEDYDDRTWPLAREWYPATGGPWHNLQPRDVRFLTREPVYPTRVLQSATVTNAVTSLAFNLKRLCYPGDRSANIARFIGALSTVMSVPTAVEIPFFLYCGWSVEVRLRGSKVSDGVLRLETGENLVTMTVQSETHLYDFGIGFMRWPATLQLQHPAGTGDNPWGWCGPLAPSPVPLSNAEHNTMASIPPEAKAQLETLGWAATAAELCRAGAIRQVPAADMFLTDSYIAFRTRQVQRYGVVPEPDALLTDNSEWTRIEPQPDGDVELLLDFGRETVGWLELELAAPAGTIVDGQLLEYLLPDGRPQYTDGNRNGFRYVTRAGRNRFTSLKRRGGRYLFLTLRNLTAPVAIRCVRLLQATYPVHQHGQFLCSDVAMNQIWDISVRTLQLCMEDTYTDCPLYEQTFWVGDARNEALYNQICFAAADLTLRGLRLTADSLTELPMTICQAPSGWNIVLPAWSLLWGINVWEYYFATGDQAGLRELYPAVIRNLRGAQRWCQSTGLLSAHTWNMFDWAGIDQNHDTVIHNSLFLVGSLDAALRCCETLGESDTAWLQAFREQTRAALLPLWNRETNSYPDAILEDGRPSPSTCSHTSALALLYDVLPDAAARAAAHRNVVAPPPGMVKVGSPFALQFFLEALEKEDDAAAALAIVRNKWQDMLDCGATTCWETFRGWESAFPTRSHCHAWSAAPIYVFSRLVLGVVPTAVGAAEIVISPHPVDGLTWARGSVASPRGNLNVAWELKAGTLSLTFTMPAGVRARVVRNRDWTTVKQLVVNGVAQELPA